MGTPETGEGVPTTGSWLTLQPGLPESLTGFLDVISGLLDFLIVVLNVVLAILQVVKAFLVGLIDPITAIIEAILAEIESLILDLRQIGLYIAGDWNLLRPNFEDLLGGFQAYERRMIGRLTDRTDPSRPAFTSASACIALFVYQSADTTGIGQLIKVIQKYMAFFGQPVPVQAYTVPTALKVTYGIDGASVTTFGSMTKALQEPGTPDTANLTWRMAPPPNGSPVAFPSLAPKGFLIEVSTVPDGLIVTYDAPVANKQPGTQGRAYGLVRDPKTKLPFRLYGGAYMLNVGDLEDPTFEEDEGDDTTTRLYASKSAADNVPIPIDSLVTTDGRFLLQRTFFVKAGFFATGAPGQGFKGLLLGSEMPYDAEFEVGTDGKVTAEVADSPATTVYVRISAVTEEVADVAIVADGQQSGPLAVPLDFWQTNSQSVHAQSQASGQVFLGTGEFTPSDKTEASLPLILTFPGSQTNAYIEAVTAALAVMALTRSDVTTPDSEVSSYAPFQDGKGNEATGLEDISRTLMPMLLGRNVKRYFERNGVAPNNFRGNLLTRCRAVANDLYRRSGPLGDLEGAAVSAAQPLMDFTWSDYKSSYPALTIIESLESRTESSGLGLNPLSVGFANVGSVERIMYGVQVVREPGFLKKRISGEDANFVMGRGSVDNSPIVYSLFPEQSDVPLADFCRNALLDQEDVLTAAATVLNIAAAPGSRPQGDAAWIAIRLFPQGLPPVDAILAEILEWVRSISAGTQAVTDVILAYIEFLEARILELQSLVVRIQGLLDLIQQFVLPSVSGLVVTGAGTDGITTALVNAGDKPQDGLQDYGGGIVFLAGGLPTLLVELLQALFGAGEE